MIDNICNFMPYRNDYYSIHIINFVFETKKQLFNGIISQAMFKAYYINSGKGILHITGKSIQVSEGDIFFTFPGVPFCIESIENFTYMYISFLGTRTNMIMEKLKISHTNFHFPNCKEIYPIWQNGLKINPEISDLIAESILLHTFYYLGDKFLLSNEMCNKINNFPINIKKFIDDNYSDCSLSLETISKQLSYSPKYISSSFKKYFKISLSDYITTLRMQHACTLIQQGFTSISDISNQCGYSDPQYFSKKFKNKMGQIPSEYIQTIKNLTHNNDLQNVHK